MFFEFYFLAAETDSSKNHSSSYRHRRTPQPPLRIHNVPLPLRFSTANRHPKRNIRLLPIVVIVLEYTRMSLELEEQQLQVHKHHKQRRNARYHEHVFILHVIILRKRRRQHHSDATQRQQTHVRRGRGRIERLLGVLQPTKEKTASEH